MVSIKNTQKQTFYIVRSIDNSIIHHGELEIGQSMESGQQILEVFQTEEDLNNRLSELNNGV
mgnify:FL=1